MDRSLTSLAMLLVFAACGDGGEGGSGGGPEPSCIEEPFTCPGGQTCWIDADGVAFECLPSGTGQDGETCQNFVGQPTCADDMICLQPQGEDGGVCTPYCDSQDDAHGCPGGRGCLSVQLDDIVFQACQPLEAQGGGGGG